MSVPLLKTSKIYALLNANKGAVRLQLEIKESDTENTNAAPRSDAELFLDNMFSGFKFVEDSKQCDPGHAVAMTLRKCRGKSTKSDIVMVTSR